MTVIRETTDLLGSLGLWYHLFNINHIGSIDAVVVGPLKLHRDQLFGSLDPFIWPMRSLEIRELVPRM